MDAWERLAARGRRHRRCAAGARRARGGRRILGRRLISAALLAAPGASAWFLGGAAVYTAEARQAFLPPGVLPEGVRSASEPCAAWLAASARERLGADWGLAETGAAAPPATDMGTRPATPASLSPAPSRGRRS